MIFSISTVSAFCTCNKAKEEFFFAKQKFGRRVCTSRIVAAREARSGAKAEE